MHDHKHVQAMKRTYDRHAFGLRGSSETGERRNFACVQTLRVFSADMIYVHDGTIGSLRLMGKLGEA